MILVTGGTGFLGRSVLRRLAGDGYPVRTLLRPSHKSPNLPRGVATEVTLAALSDQRGLRASLVGVETVIHLAGAEKSADRADLASVDVEGTRNLAEAAAEAGVRRLVFVSHLGASRSSAYPLLRAKAQAEDHIRRSGVAFTILRAAVAFGPGDSFTCWLAMSLAIAPFVFPLPGDGSSLLQPIWVEDVATCISWALEDAGTVNQTYEIGGPEFLTFAQAVRMVMQAAGIRRILVSARQPLLRGMAATFERLLPRPPVSTSWLDYLAANRTAELSTLPRVFGLQPARMETHLDYLKGHNWGWEFLARQFRQPAVE
jgi:NADH dehydrogenase